MRGGGFMHGFLHQPGAVGICVLAAVTPVSIVVGAVYARDRVDCHAIALGGVGLLFWIWAMAKVVTSGDSDWGALTFVPVVIGSILALRSHPERRAGSGYGGKLTRATTAMWQLSFACVCVLGNYLAVLFLLEPEGQMLRLYLMLGAAWWFSALVWTCTAIQSYVKTIKNSGGDVDFEEEALVAAGETVEGALTQKLRVLLAQ